MIKINLLPVPKARRSQALIMQAIAGVAAVVVVAILCLFVSIEKKSAIQDIQQKISQKQREIDDLKAKVGEVDKFKRQVQTLEAQLGVIRALEKGRVGPVKVLDELTGMVPRKLWVTTMRESGKKVSIDGMADSGPTIADFMDNLKTSKHFKGMQLTSVQSADFQGAKVHKFSISGTVVYQ